MIELQLTCGDNQEGVRLVFPATPAEIGEAFAWLDEVSRYAGEVQIIGVHSAIPNLSQYIHCVDLSHSKDIQSLNTLAERIGAMEKKEQLIFSGALDSESANGLDDVLRISESLGNYMIIPYVSSDTELGRYVAFAGQIQRALDSESANGLDDVLRISESLGNYMIIPYVSSDTELGRYVAFAGQIQSDPRFPEAAWPYLDFAKIGAEYYADHGGAYTPNGYVLRKENESVQTQDRKPIFELYLLHGQIRYRLDLPAEGPRLELAKRSLGIEDFAQAAIYRTIYGIEPMAGILPMDCVGVEDANELAQMIREMPDANLLKYLAVLSAEQPENFPAALHLAQNLDDYERITGGTYEYGQAVLRCIGADDEIIDAIDGYMDFEKLGEDSMLEDGVRQTEYGMVRRLSQPFSSCEMNEMTMIN